VGRIANRILDTAQAGILSAESRAATRGPHVRHIGFSDIKAALARGVDDFYVMPSHAVFVGAIYVIVGLLIHRVVFHYDLLPLIVPLISGFALVGPFAAMGLYELSRRRERGLDTHWRHMFGVLLTGPMASIVNLGLVLALILLTWLGTALAIYELTFGTVPLRSAQFLGGLFTTWHGWALVIFGNGIGAMFAALTFSISVVSFPLLLDKNVGVRTAVVTSIKAVWANPIWMTAWGLIIATALLIGSLPALLGLAVIFPVLGHSTWHLYRAVIQT
jgi:uncharacterized membrane protein